MGLIYDGAGQQYVPINRNVDVTGQKPWLVAVKFFPIQQGIITLRGNLYVFRNVSATTLGDFFVYDEFRLFNDREARIIQWQVTTGDIIGVTPFYDFPRIQIWSQGTGLT